MARRSGEDQLDEALEALMADGDARPRVSADLEPLLRIAAGLRDLPRSEFKQRLGAELREGPRAPAIAPKLEAFDLNALRRDLPELTITEQTTEAEADASMRVVGWMNDRLMGVMRFSGQTPWERHPGGDELLHVLDGDVEITLMTESGPVLVRASAGSVFICPQGLWHRQYAEKAVTIFYGTPVATSEFSFAEDPRLQS